MTDSDKDVQSIKMAKSYQKGNPEGIRLCFDMLSSIARIPSGPETAWHVLILIEGCLAMLHRGYGAIAPKQDLPSLISICCLIKRLSDRKDVATIVAVNRIRHSLQTLSSHSPSEKEEGKSLSLRWILFIRRDYSDAEIMDALNILKDN